MSMNLGDPGLDETVRPTLDAATVDLPRCEGRGVLVAGGFILTAAHCLQWTGTGDMALADDDYRETILTADGRTLEVAVYAVEPVTDIAVLGPVDAQRSREAADAFERYAAGTRPVPLYTGEPAPFDEELPVFTLNRDRSWVPGAASIFEPGQATLPYESAVEIQRGASGGPIVTSAGELCAVVSFGADGSTDGAGARPLRALPVWLLEKIRAAERGAPPV